MKKFFILLAFSFLFQLQNAWSATEMADHPSRDVSASAAMTRLIEGNQRFVAGTAVNPRQDAEHRKKLALGQEPFAVILSCSDSRLPPEVIFDQGLGDLFVVRLAGNILTSAALASIEYAVANLGAHLVLVLGHEYCGAVEATLKGGTLPGHLNELTEAIAPAIPKGQCLQGDKLHCAVKKNTAYVTEKLRQAQPIVAAEITKGNLQVVGAVFSIQTGKVDFLKQK